ncbi:alpha-glucuronidase [Chitinophaga silvatica]|uniref:Xylan alpha-1,2-glucuronidase n=1 Tax=Chitinophaga silvatica TaxID=2282649 RepID=A0A3E1Y293_9BACT|nr:alpha-glucuronidase family glycosyl hydrolase [Chitinophaga silvatica]RFS18809.1 alpha-glucuronidase [Chitinophaga silvatica]
MKKLSLIILLCLSVLHLSAEDGYELWLRYRPVNDPALLKEYKKITSAVRILGNTPTDTAIRNEMLAALPTMLQTNIPVNTPAAPSLLIGTLDQINRQIDLPVIHNTNDEGFIISNATIKGRKVTIITGKTPIGVLYGTFQFIRMLQTNQSVTDLPVVSSPKVQLRLLNHWDNLTRYVERGYAGISIWNWHLLPAFLDPRYTDYARLNASVGINGVVLNNVNANADILTAPYLEKVAALAKVFRPYGIKVYLSARFSAPIEIGHLSTADPLNDSVKLWWKNKANEIYSQIPDFGGFLVKANSEGQPGPQAYGRNHADGANLLADAVAPHNGIVIWRAFVYDPEANDRFKQAYDEFKPLDGRFHSNVLVQVKNGPIDFQPREPFSPLFGAMPNTPLMLEVQLTQEYLGQASHLVYEAPLFKEVLDADTYAKGKNSQISKIIDGSLYDHKISGIAAVSNIGNEQNWTMHPFAAANWYAIGRLSWDHSLSSESIASSWIKQTFGNDKDIQTPILNMMMSSREAVVNYMTPLGLHHLMGNGHHYGPAPWSNNLPREDWNPVYYHRADKFGLGFNRTSTGTNALVQYQPAVQQQWADSNTCSDQYLLWFHHVSWSHRLSSGLNLWETLCKKYTDGVSAVKDMQQTWQSLKEKIDGERFERVAMLLAIQHTEAQWWRNACLLYFQTFSGQPFPSNFEKPDHTLEYYQQLKFRYAPGN